MLTDGPEKWGPDNSNSASPTHGVPTFDSTASVDSIGYTKHTPPPGQTNLPKSHHGSSHRWKQPFRAIARACKTVLPNTRSLFTKRLKPAGPPKPNPASRLSVSSAEPTSSEQNIFLADAPIQLYHGPRVPFGDQRYGVVMYDSGCEYDLISTAHIAERRKPEEDVVKRTFAMSITGERFDSLGTVRIRWKDANFKALRYMDTECLIVESDFFDVIIGRRTMQKEQLYVRNPDLIAPLLTPSPKVDNSRAEMIRRNQEAKIKREQELQAQADEESKRG